MTDQVFSVQRIADEFDGAIKHEGTTVLDECSHRITDTHPEIDGLSTRSYDGRSGSD
jgi:hypothetical protein